MEAKIEELNEELNKNNKKKTHIVAILDMSGSMYSLKDDVIGSFNNFMQEQQKNDDPAEVSLVLFDNIVERPFTKIDISNVNDINESTYSPRGSTALYDAIGTTIARFKDDKNVILLIQTDGMENSSKEYKQSDIKKLIEDKEKDGWDINFLAADIDVVATANSMGIAASKSVAFSKSSGGLKDAYAAMSNSTSLYRGEVSKKETND